MSEKIDLDALELYSQRWPLPYDTAAKLIAYARELEQAAKPADPTITIGARDVLAERRRQVVELGFTDGRDARYINGELFRAACCYAKGTMVGWPWDRCWWNPQSHRQNVVRAAALLLAEIDRIDYVGGTK